ncbi:hypothetical protein pb186bvf_020683 [Paramecium bursaria]
MFIEKKLNLKRQWMLPKYFQRFRMLTQILTIQIFLIFIQATTILSIFLINQSLVINIISDASKYILETENSRFLNTITPHVKHTFQQQLDAQYNKLSQINKLYQQLDKVQTYQVPYICLNLANKTQDPNQICYQNLSTEQEYESLVFSSFLQEIHIMQQQNITNELQIIYNNKSVSLWPSSQYNQSFNYTNQTWYSNNIKQNNDKIQLSKHLSTFTKDGYIRWHMMISKSIIVNQKIKATVGIKFSFKNLQYLFDFSDSKYVLFANDGIILSWSFYKNIDFKTPLPFNYTKYTGITTQQLNTVIDNPFSLMNNKSCTNAENVYCLYNSVANKTLLFNQLRFNNNKYIMIITSDNNYNTEQELIHLKQIQYIYDQIFDIFFIIAIIFIINLLVQPVLLFFICNPIQQTILFVKQAIFKAKDPFKIISLEEIENSNNQLRMLQSSCIHVNERFKQLQSKKSEDCQIIEKFINPRKYRNERRFAMQLKYYIKHFNDFNDYKRGILALIFKKNQNELY